MTTRVLDRVPAFDERSKNYRVRPLGAVAIPRRPKVWRPRWTPLDQGEEGACVGFGFSGDFAATPIRHQVDDKFARLLYQAAQQEDRKMGNYFDSGASMLAGAKAALASGYISEYRWAFGVNELIDALLTVGPCLIGIPWRSNMYETVGENFMVDVGGDLVGGHCIMVNGYFPAYAKMGEVLVWTNSWGTSYGRNGRGYIRKADLQMLLDDNGEVCVPIDRLRV